MFRLGQLSDIHLGPAPSVRPSHLISKRLIGHANLRGGRRHHFDADTLARLVGDLKHSAPDHIAVLGDLTNLATEEELQNARAWLEQLGPPDRVTVIPGNHDAYVPGRHRVFQTLWAPWMRGDEAGEATAATFPFMRRRDHVALIAMSSAVASPPFMATGRVGPEQTRRLAELLDQAGAEGRFRIVLIHHPPRLINPRHQWRKLTDGRRLSAVLDRHGAELILHGHDHRHSLVRIGDRDIPMVGVPSASAAATDAPHGGGYALHEIEENGGGITLTIIRRGYDASGEITEIERTSLAYPAKNQA